MVQSVADGAFFRDHNYIGTIRHCYDGLIAKKNPVGDRSDYKVALVSDGFGLLNRGRSSYEELQNINVLRTKRRVVAGPEDRSSGTIARTLRCWRRL